MNHLAAAMMASPPDATSSYSVFLSVPRSRMGGKRMWISCLNSARHAGHVPHPGWGTLSILCSQDRWKINGVSRAEWPEKLAPSRLGLFFQSTSCLPSFYPVISPVRYKTNCISRSSLEKRANERITKTSRSSHSGAPFVERSELKTFRRS